MIFKVEVFFKHFLILYKEPFIVNTELSANLPFCLSPILMLFVPKKGASIIALEEFPIIRSTSFYRDKKILEPTSLKNIIFFFELFFFTNDLIFLLISKLQISLFAKEKNMFE